SSSIGLLSTIFFEVGSSTELLSSIVWLVLARFAIFLKIASNSSGVEPLCNFSLFCCIVCFSLFSVVFTRSFLIVLVGIVRDLFLRKYVGIFSIFANSSFFLYDSVGDKEFHLYATLFIFIFITFFSYIFINIILYIFTFDMN